MYSQGKISTLHGHQMGIPLQWKIKKILLVVTFIAARNFKIKIEQPFKFEVNEIEWNKVRNLFFLTNGQGCIHILRVMMNCFQIFNLA